MLAFVHIHKTAGITVNWILRRSYGFHHCDVEPWQKTAKVFSAADYCQLEKLYPQIDSIAGHKVKAFSDLEQVRPDVRYFTFLREPLIRCASHFQYAIQHMKKNLSFDDWLDDRVSHNFQTRQIAGAEDLDTAIRLLEKKFIHVGLVEHFDESLLLFQRQVADPRLNILYQARNVAPSDKIKNELLLDPRQRARLEKVNQLDLQLHAYVCRELYPRQRREYGKTLDADLAAFRVATTEMRIDQKLLLNRVATKFFYQPLLFCYRHNIWPKRDIG